MCWTFLLVLVSFMQDSVQELMLCPYVHAEGQQYRLLGVASPCPLLLFLSLLLLLLAQLLVVALLLFLLHLLSAVINDGLDAVSVGEQEGVSLPGAHVPDPDPL